MGGCPPNALYFEPQNIEVKNIVLFPSKTSAVLNSLFDIRYSNPPVGAEADLRVSKHSLALMNCANFGPQGPLTRIGVFDEISGVTWFEKGKIGDLRRDKMKFWVL